MLCALLYYFGPFRPDIYGSGNKTAAPLQPDPYSALTCPVQNLYGTRTEHTATHGYIKTFEWSNAYFIGAVQVLNGCLMAPLLAPTVFDTAKHCKIPHRCLMWSCRTCRGSVQFPHRMFTGCLQSLNPYRAHKLIMHASNLYGLCMGWQNLYCTIWASCGDIGFLFKTAQEQPVWGLLQSGSVIWRGYEYGPAHKLYQSYSHSGRD